MHTTSSQIDYNASNFEFEYVVFVAIATTHSIISGLISNNNPFSCTNSLMIVCKASPASFPDLLLPLVEELGGYFLERKLKRNDNKKCKVEMAVDEGVYLIKAGQRVSPTEGVGLGAVVHALSFASDKPHYQ